MGDQGCTPYYYKSRRIGNAVRKVYLGAGDVAKQAAANDAAAKAKRVADQAALADFQARLAGVDQLAADVDQGVRSADGGSAIDHGIPRASRRMEATT